ncbi:MAG: rhodanese-like domain-containing protein [Phycisphaerales bacterium]|jgi:rhodanese-related sulfurtransferase|nr:rhodanese-like domain-containing protein [Phycisphaerales bacterium]
MARLVFLVTISLVGTLFLGCSTGISDKNLVYVNNDEAESLMQKGDTSLFGTESPTILVDARVPFRYSQGHIPGSMNVPLETLFFDAWKLDEAGIIIVSGETWNDAVAIAMSKELIKKGFKDVRTLKGGLTGWTDSGRAVEKGL